MEPLFWERLKQSLPLEAVTEIMIVDDFGFNETAGDAYAALAKVDKRKARKGRNPQTGEEIKIKAKRVPKFVPGKALKDAV